MQITLTDPQKTAIRNAMTAYKTAKTQVDAVAVNYAAKQDALRVAFDLLLVATTIPSPEPGDQPILLTSFRLGNKLIRINAGAAYEDDSAPDVT